MHSWTMRGKLSLEKRKKTNQGRLPEEVVPKPRVEDEEEKTARYKERKVDPGEDTVGHRLRN